MTPNEHTFSGVRSSPATPRRSRQRTVKMRRSSTG